jgi:hypothetical protein
MVILPTFITLGTMVVLVAILRNQQTQAGKDCQGGPSSTLIPLAGDGRKSPALTQERRDSKLPEPAPVFTRQTSVLPGDEGKERTQLGLPGRTSMTSQ